MTFPASHEKLLLQGPAGLLEVSAEIPRVTQRNAVAVICHPHPVYQGTMNNKVVTTLARVYKDAGIPAIRFNYRGVEKSAGEYANGIGEIDDALALMAWAAQQCPGRELWLAGFSFGGFIAGSVAAQLPISHLVTVGPAVENFNFADVGPIDCPWLVVQGEQDDVVNPQAVTEFVKQRAEQPQYITFADCGHFFHGRLVALREAVNRAIQPHLPEELPR